MKKILILLSFVMVATMANSNYEMDVKLSEKERFEMLFGKTGLQFNEVRKVRKTRSIRENRVLSEKSVLEISRLTKDEKYELLFANTISVQRVERTTRLIFPRQARKSLYITLNLK